MSREATSTPPANEGCDSAAKTNERVLTAEVPALASALGAERAVVLDGDCLVELKKLPDASVDSCVCDGPYGLSDEVDVAQVLACWLANKPYQHRGGGFQGAKWDSFVPGPELWREVFRVLKPGGYLLAFGATRRYDLLGLAIRLAGFTIRDSLHWVYANGNGGTKSHNLSLAIDKAAGAKRRVVGERKANVGLKGGNYGKRSKTGTVPVTEPATEAAKQWQGWGTSVAPAHEPIIIAQKPVEVTYAGNLLTHGVGGLNIDGCKTDNGRWPKNILFSHSPDCAETCTPDCPVAALDEQHGKGVADKFPVFPPETPFLYCAKPSREERNAGLDDSFEERSSDPRSGRARGVFAEKGGAPQKNHHPTAKPIALMAWLCRLVTPPGGIVLDPFAGSGSTGCGAVAEGFRFIGVELDEEYVTIARQRVAHAVAHRRQTSLPASTTSAAQVADAAPASPTPATGVAAPAGPLPTEALVAAPPPASEAATPRVEPALLVAKLGQTAAIPQLAITAGDSQNKKLGQAATTYAAQSSCPTSCPFFNGGGCYAESGHVGLVTARLNAAANAQPSGPDEVAEAEAAAIDALKVVPGRPLRLHTVGDCATDEAARIVAAAAGRYRRRGGGPVWTYTHAWRDVSRESWGDVSVLASCETAADVRLARARGYATAVVVNEVTTEARHQLDERAGEAAGLDVLPCPQQTRGRTCSECRLCFDDKDLIARGYSIAFAVHGAPATVRHAKKALRSPDDPDRRLSTRELIPRVIAELEAAGKHVTNAAIARHLQCNASSVAQMRAKLAREPARAVPRPPAGDASPTSCARDTTHELGDETPCPDATPQLPGVMASQTTNEPPPANARRPHPVVGRRAGRPTGSEVAR